MGADLNIYLSSIIGTLDNIYADTISLFDEIKSFSKKTDTDSDNKAQLTYLNLNAGQKKRSLIIYNKYMVWALGVVELLNKYSIDLKAGFIEASNQTKSYILFERVGNNITQKRWRELYLQELSGLIDVQKNILVYADEKFSFRKQYFWCFKNHQHCNINIKYNPELVFVLMPFDDVYLDVYELGIKSSVESYGLNCLRADEFDHSKEIICSSICQPIQEARIIIADITGRNPNVYYELGLCHGFEKEVILVVQDIKDVPFDLLSLNIITYERVADLKNKLKKRLAFYLKNKNI